MNTTIADVYWATWLIVLFGAPEAYAVATGHTDWTLSGTTWRWFDVIPGQTIWQWSIVHLLLAMFMTWLWLHMVFGIFKVWGGHW